MAAPPYSACTAQRVAEVRCVLTPVALFVFARMCDDGQVLHATGGGALKYAAPVKHETGIDLMPQDEMSCLIHGLNFLLLEVPYAVFTYSARTPMQFHDSHLRSGRFPYLLVNIGSGVSILHVRICFPCRAPPAAGR